MPRGTRSPRLAGLLTRISIVEVFPDRLLWRIRFGSTQPKTHLYISSKLFSLAICQTRRAPNIRLSKVTIQFPGCEELQLRLQRFAVERLTADVEGHALDIANHAVGSLYSKVFGYTRTTRHETSPFKVGRGRGRKQSWILDHGRIQTAKC